MKISLFLSCSASLILFPSGMCMRIYGWQHVCSMLYTVCGITGRCTLIRNSQRRPAFTSDITTKPSPPPLSLAFSFCPLCLSFSVRPKYRLLSARDTRLDSRPYFRPKMGQTSASRTIMRALEDRKTCNESSAVLFRFHIACPTGTTR